MICASDDVHVHQPDVLHSRGTDLAQVAYNVVDWLTPGLFVARLLGDDDAVRSVHENVLPDGTYYITVALRADPREVMNRVFDAERRAHEEFKGLHILVRATAMLSDEDIADLSKTVPVPHFLLKPA